MDNRNKGIYLMIASSLFFALMATCVKLAGDMPTMQKVFFRNVVGFIYCGFAIIKSGEGFKGNNTKFLLYRSVLGFLGIVLYFYAIGKLPLADAVILNQMNPFFVIILAALFLKEKLKKLQIAAILVALAGVFFVAQPEFNYTLIPTIAGLLSSIFAASAYTMLRHLRLTDSPNIILFYFTGFCTLVPLPFLIFGDFVMPDLGTFIILLLVGVFATIAQYLMTIAYRYARASDISIYSYGNTIFSGLIGILIWSEIPNNMTTIGIVLILLGAYLNYHSSKTQVEN